MPRIVIRRTSLTVVAGLLLSGLGLLALGGVLSGNTGEDALSRSTAWPFVGFAILLGAFYQYASARVVADDQGIEVRNPIRTWTITWSAVQRVRSGWHPILETSAGDVQIWAIERRNLDSVLGEGGPQTDLAELVDQKAGHHGPATVINRLRWPGWFWWLCESIWVCAVGLLLTFGHPTGWL